MVLKNSWTNGYLIDEFLKIVQIKEMMNMVVLLKIEVDFYLK